MKISEDVWSVPQSEPKRRFAKNNAVASAFPVKIGELRYHHLRELLFSFIGSSLHIFKNVPVKAVIAQFFQLGVRNWSVDLSWCKIEVFNLQTRDSCLRCESWQV